MSENKSCTSVCALSLTNTTPVSTEQIAMWKVDAQTYGLDQGVIADILEKWGSVVLGLAIEAFRNGFCQAFIIDTLYKLGPAVLQFILSFVNKKKMSMAADMPTDTVGMDTSFLVVVSEQVLPVIFEKFGPEILKAVEEAILNSIRKEN